MRSVDFTMENGSRELDIGVQQFIKVDGVNEAEETFIFVLEITDTQGNDVNFDDEAGILIYTILDDDRESNTASVWLSMYSQSFSFLLW